MSIHLRKLVFSNEIFFFSDRFAFISLSRSLYRIFIAIAIVVCVQALNTPQQHSFKVGKNVGIFLCLQRLQSILNVRINDRRSELAVVYFLTKRSSLITQCVEITTINFPNHLVLAAGPFTGKSEERNSQQNSFLISSLSAKYAMLT